MFKTASFFRIAPDFVMPPLDALERYFADRLTGRYGTHVVDIA